MLFTLVVLLLDVVEVCAVVLPLVVETIVLLLDEELVGSGAVGLCESQLVTTTSPATHMTSASAVRENLGDRGVRTDSDTCLAAIVC